MEGRHVVITLTPVYLPDTLPFRTLTLADEDDCISVGRASKSESKNLVPSHDNAWFDSRVMSRNHAVICASFADKKVLVCDSGSMHGTFVNDDQIPMDQEVEITNGDIVTFGSEVTRWPKDGRPRDPSNPFALDTFPPLKVRCESQWFDDDGNESDGQPDSLHETSRNSFSVPEEEEEEEEVVDGDIEVIPETAENKPRVFSPIHFTLPYSDAEGSDDDSEDEVEEPKSSPPTSHSGESKESVTRVDDKEAESKPFPDNKNSNLQRLNIVAPSAGPEQPPAATAQNTGVSSLGSQGSPIDVDGGTCADCIEDWEEKDKRDASSAFVVDKRGADEPDNIPAAPSNEASYSEPTGITDGQPEKPGSRPEDASTEARHRLSTPESFSGSYGQPYVEPDSEGYSEVEDCISEKAVKDDVKPSYPRLVPATCTVSRIENNPFNRDTTSPQMEAPSSYSQSDSLSDLRALCEKAGPSVYSPDDWNTPAYGSFDFPPRVPSPSDKALAKPLESELTDRVTSASTGWRAVQQTSLSSAPTDFLSGGDQMRADNLNLHESLGAMSQPYSDGPFQGFRKPEVPQPAPLRLSRFKEVPPFPPATNQGAQLRTYDPTPPWHQQASLPRFNPFHNGNKEMEGQEDSDAVGEISDNEGGSIWGGRNRRAPLSRVSISDIVAESDREFNMRGLGKGLKRKASEMERNHRPTVEPTHHEEAMEDHAADGAGVNESLGLSDSIPDAQPQNLVQEVGHSTSQLTQMSASKTTEENARAPDQEPPSKRVKLSTPATNAARPRSNFAKYAATALAGAVVGGVGAIATLIALPPEFFS